MDSHNPLTCESEIKFYLLMIRYRKITEGSYYLLMSYIVLLFVMNCNSYLVHYT